MRDESRSSVSAFEQKIYNDHIREDSGYGDAINALVALNDRAKKVRPEVSAMINNVIERIRHEFDL